MDFISLPPARPPPRLGLPRAILSNLEASSCVQIRLQTLQLSKYLSIDESDLFWKFSKLSFPATFAQQAKTRKYLPKESRNLLVEISAFHAGMNWMIDLISDWLVWMFRQTLDDLSAMSSRNRSAEGERANAAATSGAPSLEGSFKTQNILPFLTILRGYLRQRFILK